MVTSYLLVGFSTDFYNLCKEYFKTEFYASEKCYKIVGYRSFWIMSSLF
ncbi:hypothetical protein LEP1GSC005_1331 [Leptospira santarosai str. ST188]|nr:hypothetical protein LEP1GSC005_1331 [Leptospira santarosai str. ST188]